jgi:protein-L-isoaspartate(D-aspartate) O-methyltransferase
MDYSKLRQQMVCDQLLSRDIKDPKIAEAFAKIERERFVTDEFKLYSYDDRPLPIKSNQTISQPYIVALMAQLLELKGDEKVLEVGTGSGYETAILSALTREVYTIERFQELSNDAKVLLGVLGCKNITYKIGDGSEGWNDFAPYERIIVSAASEKVPEPLLEQLNDPGIMVIPIGGQFSQVLTIIKKDKGKLNITNSCACAFVPLVGKYV